MSTAHGDAGGQELAGVTRLSEWIADRGSSVPDGAAGSALDAESAPPEQPDEQALVHAAVRALGRRAMSRRELVRWLADRGGAPEGVAYAVGEMERLGYLDDDQLAHDLAERLRARKSLGARGVAAELQRRGLDPSVLDAPDADEELARAIAAAESRRSRLGGLDQESADRRLSSWLQRRGYSGGVVRAAVERSRPKSSGPRFV